eukprot:m.95571 g.95571  ORF g.95571 m.95571 type:complete len:86 (+) comp13500_c0_seq2:3240-3497(+)
MIHRKLLPKPQSSMFLLQNVKHNVWFLYLNVNFNGLIRVLIQRNLHVSARHPDDLSYTDMCRFVTILPCSSKVYLPTKTWTSINE